MFLPTTMEEVRKLGWDSLDIILISGDTYIDSSYNGSAPVSYTHLLFIQSGLYLVLFLMLILIIAKEPSFLSIRNFKNILTQSSVRAIIAVSYTHLFL